MSRLSKAQTKLHNQAMELINDSRQLTSEEIDFCYLHYNEGASHDQNNGAAFFTPVEMARDMGLETIRGGELVDLCAGTGRLAYYCTRRDWHPDHRPRFIRIVCIEQNPEFVRIGKRLFPEAQWICGDVTDPALLQRIGKFDQAISNPPFGKVTGQGKALRYHGRYMELRVLDIMATIAPTGWAIVPGMTAPFNSNDRRAYVCTKRADEFTAATGLGLHRFASLDVEYYQDDWNGTAPRLELVEFDPENYDETAVTVQQSCKQSRPIARQEAAPIIPAIIPQPAAAQLALF